jgi:membrane protein YqaA with SNARE-associated domain
MAKKQERRGEKPNFFHLYTIGVVRKIYDWVLSWAESRYATWALFILAFIEASCFIIPPDVLLLSLSLAKPRKAWRYATISTAGSVIGGMFGWFIGHALYGVIGRRIIEGLGYQAQFAYVGQLYQQNAFWFIFTAAFTPIPYKVFTIAAGVWSIGIPTLVLASILGRGGRFFIEGGLIYFVGPRVKQFIDRYFDWLTIAAGVLLVGGFFAIKYLT